MRLLREVRFYGGGDVEQSHSPPWRNSWAGSDARGPLPPFWTLRVAVEGPVDPRTGFLCDIKQIDSLVHEVVAPRLRVGATAGESGVLDALATDLAAALSAVGRRLPPPLRVESLQLFLSPFTHLSTLGENPAMVRLTQSYEFSASHRLHCQGLSDEENRRIFGKCSNPHGHGHNYVLEVTVSGEPDPRTGRVFDLAALDQSVARRVIEPLDHKNLNVECPEFASLNPTVENIARVIFQRLAGTFEGLTLLGVRVWETPKTCAEYSGDK